MRQRNHQGPALWTVLSCSLAMALAGCSTSTSSMSGPSPDFNGASTATASEISASVGSMTMTQSTQSAGALGAIQDDLERPSASPRNRRSRGQWLRDDRH